MSHPGRGGSGAGGGGGGGGGSPAALFGGGGGGAGGSCWCPPPRCPTSGSSSSGTTTNVCSGCVKFMLFFLSKAWAGHWANLPLTIGSFATSFKTLLSLDIDTMCVSNRFWPAEMNSSRNAIKSS